MWGPSGSWVATVYSLPFDMVSCHVTGFLTFQHCHSENLRSWICFMVNLWVLLTLQI